MHGGKGGKPSKCIWIDAYRMAYTQFLCDHNIPEYYIPAQHNTKSNARVALWQKESDDMAKSALQHAAEGQVPMPEALDDLMLRLHDGILAADIVRTLDAQYNNSLPTLSSQLPPSEYPNDSKCKVV